MSVDTDENTLPIAWMRVGQSALAVDTQAVVRVAQMQDLDDETQDSAWDLIDALGLPGGKNLSRVQQLQRFVLLIAMRSTERWLIGGTSLKLEHRSNMVEHMIPALILDLCEELGVTAVLEHDGQLAYLLDPSKVAAEVG